MKRVLNWFLIVTAVILFSQLAFALYAHFLLDYSLENLQLAIAGAQNENKTENSSALTQNIYRSVVEDLALDEASREKADYENLVLLDLASRSFSEADQRAGYDRAKVYLHQVKQNKTPGRHSMFRTLDAAYRQMSQYHKSLDSFLQYVHRQLFSRIPKVQESLEYSSLLLLTQAEDKEKARQFSEAAELYRKYLKLYPGRPDRGFVSLSLAQSLIKEKSFDEAEALLKDIRQAFAGSEESEIASKLIQRIDFLKERKELILKLTEAINSEKDPAKAERLQFKYALANMSFYQLDDALKSFQSLANSSDPELRQKSKFYMGWIYKLNSQFERGEKILSDLLKDPTLIDDLKLGLTAELADIYYQKKDIQKSLSHYQELGRSSSVSEKPEEMRGSIAFKQDKALKRAWTAIAEFEQANIYYYDVEDREEGKDRLRRAKNIFPEISFKEIEIGFENFSPENLRDRAFRALETKQISVAYDLFNKNLTYHPDDAWSHSALATINILFGDLDTALEYAEKGYDLDPDEYTISVFGYVLSFHERYEEALAMYRQALSRNPRYLPANFNLACMYLRMKDYEKGFQILEGLSHKVGIGSPLKSKIYNNKGYALWWLGKHEEAVNDFKQALKFSPDFLPAKTNLAQVSGNQAPQAISLKE